MRHFRRLVLLLAVPFIILTTAALTAGMASAGTVPGTLGQATAAAHHHRGLRPEFFTVTVVNNNNGVVNAYGPVRGIGGTDVESTPTMGVFSFSGPVRSVNIFHTDVDNVTPVVTSWRFCIATASADGNWAFGGGTGIYRNATGFGTFHFTLLLVLQRYRNGRCDTNPNAAPRYSLVRVTGTGLAARN
jgi:hypothetical protein